MSHNSCLIENKVLIPSSHNIPAVRHETNSYSLEIGARKSNSMWATKRILNYKFSNAFIETNNKYGNKDYLTKKEFSPFVPKNNDWWLHKLQISINETRLINDNWGIGGKIFGLSI